MASGRENSAVRRTCTLPLSFVPYLRVGNPIERRPWLTTDEAEKILLGTIRGAAHLHSLGVVHGDLSLSNILLKTGDEVRIADFGAVTGHTFLTGEKLCVAYIRPPEAILGSERKGPGVDAWAVGLIAIAIYTGKVPTLGSSSEEKERILQTFCAAFQLLPPITEENWPGHRLLPRWKEYEQFVPVSPRCGGLRDYICEHYLGQKHHDEPLRAASFIEGSLRWDPDARYSLQHMGTKLVGC